MTYSRDKDLKDIELVLPYGSLASISMLAKSRLNDVNRAMKDISSERIRAVFDIEQKIWESVLSEVEHKIEYE